MAYASAIEPSRSGTWSPNRFSLFDRLARSWFFLFSFDVYKTWMFLSSNLDNRNRAGLKKSVIGMQINWALTHITLTPHLPDSRSEIKYHFLYLSLSCSSFPLKNAWCLFLISWFSCEHLFSSSASCSFRLDKVFCRFAYSVSSLLFRFTLKYSEKSKSTHLY